MDFNATNKLVEVLKKLVENKKLNAGGDLLNWSGIISMEDLSENQREIAEVIGLDTYIALTQHFGGESPYIPKFDELVKDPRNREIRKKYNGHNSTELARKYRLSERYIRQLTSDLRKMRQSQPIEEQLFFDNVK